MVYDCGNENLNPAVSESWNVRVPHTHFLTLNFHGQIRILFIDRVNF